MENVNYLENHYTIERERERERERDFEQIMDPEGTIGHVHNAYRNYVFF